MIKHLVADLDAATKLFAGPLAMTVTDQGTETDGDYSHLVQGPWNLRLIKPTSESARQWLADRPGRLLQVEIEVDDPAVVPDIRRTDRGLELAPEFNLGTRVVLKARPT